MTYDNGHCGHISTTMDSPNDYVPLLLPAINVMSAIPIPVLDGTYLFYFLAQGWFLFRQVTMVIGYLCSDMQDFRTLYGVDLVQKAKLEAL